MKYVIIDTNFILACIKQKIDFFEEIKFMGLRVIIPQPVIRELGNLAKYDKKYHVREDAQFAVKLLERNKFEKIGLDMGSVDAGIIKAAREDKELVLATLDRRINGLTKNSRLVIRGKKKLEIMQR